MLLPIASSASTTLRTVSATWLASHESSCPSCWPRLSMALQDVAEGLADELHGLLEDREHRLADVADRGDHVAHEVVAVGDGGLEDLEDAPVGVEQRLREVGELVDGPVDDRRDRLDQGLEGTDDRLDDVLDRLLDLVDDVLDELDDRVVVVRLAVGCRLTADADLGAQVGDVRPHLLHRRVVPAAGGAEHVVLHQRATVRRRQLADRVHDPLVLVGVAVALDQGAPLLGVPGERHRLEHLAVLVDGRQRRGVRRRQPSARRASRSCRSRGRRGRPRSGSA